MRFTDAKLKAIKPTSSRNTIWEAGKTGFGVRVEPTGTKTFVLWYRIEGKPAGITIGRYPKIKLHEARAKAAEMKEKISKGEDPRIKIQTEKRIEREAETVAELVHDYIERYAKKKRKGSWKEDQRMLNKDVLPAWGRRKARSITKKNIVALLDNVVDRGSPIAANRLLGVIRLMFQFAVSRDMLSSSPCVAVEPPGEENIRDRVLIEEEMKKFWYGLDHAKMDETTKLALKLLLTTAQRKAEVASAEWTEFDLAAKWWTIPSSKSKNNQPHRVWLSSLSLAVLNQIKEISGDNHFLFPSPVRRKRTNDESLAISNHITGRAISQSLLNNQTEPKDDSTKEKKKMDAFGVEHFTPHDLRRTCATNMTKLGVSRFIVGRVLNHLEKKSATSIYDHYTYDKEKQLALDVWARKLESIITGRKSKIIQIKK